MIKEMPLELAEQFGVCTMLWHNDHTFDLIDMTGKNIASVVWGLPQGDRKRYIGVVGGLRVDAWQARAFVNKLHKAVSRRLTQEKTDVRSPN